jgi:hypothetical protein
MSGSNPNAMDNFLRMCNIPLNYQPVCNVLSSRKIVHWSALKNLSIESLQTLGFGWGTNQLILVGVKKATKFEWMMKRMPPALAR